jgi:hypothetical protein
MMQSSNTPQALSIELVWNGNPNYLNYTISVIDIELDNGRRYTASVPKDAQAGQDLSLTCQNHQAAYQPKAQFLSITSLKTASALTLKAGMFKEMEGNTITRNADGTWGRDTYLKREDITVKLDFSTAGDLHFGNHYKIIVTHTDQNTTAKLIADGLYRQNALSTTPSTGLVSLASSPEGMELARQQMFQQINRASGLRC